MNVTRTIFAGVVFAGACVQPSATPSVQPAPAPIAQAPVATVSVSSPTIEPQATPVVSRPAASVKRADTVAVLSSDVSRRAAEVFGDSAKPSAAEPDSDSAPSWDIDVESYASTARVEHYVRMFTGSAKDRIETRLSRGTQYEAMIRGKLRDGGLPEDMYYLALIESGFDPNAYSRAAAVGMWQFMTSTGRDMGLRIDWWVDERRDPFKSTSAAVRFIKGLNEQFGSLYLAAAAYNGGPGRVSRGLSRYADDLEGTSGDDLFFALADKDYFRNETREYVPQLIAAALIAKDSERYGLEIESRPAIEYDSVRVGPVTPIAAVARASNVSVSEVAALNPHVLRGITPPKDSFFVRLPVGRSENFAESFAALPKGERVGLHTVISKKGQSLTSIAKSQGVSAKQIGAYNQKLKFLKSGNLAPGQAILVPTEAVASAAVAVPDPAIERYGPARASSVTHVVKSGETLSGIAKKYHTTTALLMKSNALKRPLIFPGQSLIVSGKAAPKSTASAKSSKSSAKSAKSTTKSKAKPAAVASKSR